MWPGVNNHLWSGGTRKSIMLRFCWGGQSWSCCLVSVRRSGKTHSNRFSESKTYCGKRAPLKTLRRRAVLAKQSKHDAVSWLHHLSTTGCCLSLLHLKIGISDRSGDRLTACRTGQEDWLDYQR